MKGRHIIAAAGLTFVACAAHARDEAVMAALFEQQERHPFYQCLLKFEESAASVDMCGGSRCWEDADGKTLEQRCGDPPADYLRLLDALNAAETLVQPSYKEDTPSRAVIIENTRVLIIE